ncbi:MAG: tRNA (N6-threonylcarbamoyladenosine(37)-N6)-methyltransferase TrmO [Chloroflexi bacterium]|nr:tRNA (N6-threonylcarbamoyladenosine(37)-N6)-methyltransferase TrmO [Chloroflexota bacterium]
MEIILKPIGIIISPFNEKEQTPIQSSRSQAIGRIEVAPEFSDGLQDIEGFSHIILLYVFHCAAKDTLQVRPFLDAQLHGVFSTRYPNRPNPIGLSVVRLLARWENTLEIAGIDVLDGTPLLDIKPYIPEFDVYEASRIGWYASRRQA